MKRVLALTMVLIMCFALAAHAEEFETVIEKGEYTLPLVTEPTELRYMVRDVEEAGASFLNGNSLVWNKFMEETGVTIVFECVPVAEYKQMMELRFASQSDLPDIVSVEGKQDGVHISRYYDEGILQPLNQLIEDYAPNIKRVYEQYPELKSPMTLPDGEQAAIGGLSLETSFASCAIRQDWLDALDLEMPTNPDELLEVALAFMEGDPNGNGEKDEIGLGPKELFDLKQYGSMFGLSLCTSNGWSLTEGNQIVYEWTTDAYRDFVRFLNEAYNRGALPKDFASYTGDQYNARVAEGTTGITSRLFNSEYYKFLVQGESNQNNQPGSLWVPISFEEYKGYTPTYIRDAKASVWRSEAITTAAKDKPLAIRFMDYCLAGEGSEMNGLGIEGLSYVWNDDGIMISIPDWRDTYEDPSAFLGNGYISVFKAKDYTLEGYVASVTEQNPIAAEVLNSRMDFVDASTKPVFQCPIPTQEDGARMSEILTDLNTYRDEMFVKFINGEKSIEDDWDEYLQGMDAMGATEVRDIYQKGADML